jgi:hypothetical protein
LSLLFTLLIGGLARAIARTGGTSLAEQFEEQVNRYAGQHGWRVLTGLTTLTELRQRVPVVDAKMLLSVYVSYAQYAQTLAGQILGEQMLKSTLWMVLSDLPPQLAEANSRHGIICPS